MVISEIFSAEYKSVECLPGNIFGGLGSVSSKTVSLDCIGSYGDLNGHRAMHSGHGGGIGAGVEGVGGGHHIDHAGNGFAHVVHDGGGVDTGITVGGIDEPSPLMAPEMVSIIP